MPTYMISVTFAAALSGIIMSVIFYRMKIFSFRTAASITMASLVTALIMPGIFSIVSSFNGSTQDSSLPPIIIISLLAYFILAFIFSIVISFVLPKIKIGHKTALSVPNPGITEVVACTDTPPASESSDISGSVISESVQEALPVLETAHIEVTTAAETGVSGDNYIEKIYLDFVGRNDEDMTTIANNEVNEAFDKNSVEKSVDSDENIDKMGIENNIHDSSSLTIEECIDEAFRLREQGDLEGSILYYMYALDKKPQIELTFWIILDICVMYKSLGQQDLALDILDSYYDIYCDEMDSSVREEIIRNLTDIRA